MRVNFSRLWKHSFGKNRIVAGSTWKSLKLNAFKICAEIGFTILAWLFKGQELRMWRNQELYGLIDYSVDSSWSDVGGKRNVMELSRFVLLFCEADNAYQQALERILTNVRKSKEISEKVPPLYEGLQLDEKTLKILY